MFLAFVGMLPLCEPSIVCPPCPGNLKPGAGMGARNMACVLWNVSRDSGMETGLQKTSCNLIAVLFHISAKSYNGIITEVIVSCLVSILLRISMLVGTWTICFCKTEVRKTQASTEGNSGESLIRLFSAFIYVWFFFSGILILLYKLVKMYVWATGFMDRTAVRYHKPHCRQMSKMKPCDLSRVSKFWEKLQAEAASWSTSGFRAFTTRGRDCPKFPVAVSWARESIDMVLMIAWPI